MKRFLFVLLILALIPITLPANAFAETQALPVGLQDWMLAFQASYDPLAYEGSVSLPGWHTHHMGEWSYQYPPEWTKVSGDEYSFSACDSRELSCIEFCQAYQFRQPLTHDQVGTHVFSRIAGNSPSQVARTFQKNLYPELTLTPPDGIAQVWFVQWQHPQAIRMFTVVEVTVWEYRDLTDFGIPEASGRTTVSWVSYTSPEDEFTATWQNVFNLMHLLPPV